MTNGPGEMQHSAETVKMEETHTGSMDDTANLKVDEDLLMDKSGGSISVLVVGCASCIPFCWSISYSPTL